MVIVGHEQLIKDLKNLADQDKLSHGYIFWGPERVGKRTVALALANYLENGNFSPDHKKILNDCLLIQPGENKIIGIDQVREIKHFLSQKPNVSRRRLVTIDNGHLLTDEAQNALLKTVEDPPSSALIILIIKDPESIRMTVASRLQKIYFPSISKKKIKEWLVEKQQCSPAEA